MSAGRRAANPMSPGCGSNKRQVSLSLAGAQPAQPTSREHQEPRCGATLVLACSDKQSMMPSWHGHHVSHASSGNSSGSSQLPTPTCQVACALSRPFGFMPRGNQSDKTNLLWVDGMISFQATSHRGKVSRRSIRGRPQAKSHMGKAAGSLLLLPAIEEEANETREAGPDHVLRITNYPDDGVYREP